MSNAIKKVNFVNQVANKVSSVKQDSPVSSISTFNGTVYEEFDDGSWKWTEDYKGKETTFHEYSDGTKTLDYIGKHGKRIIDTVDEDGNLLNRRFFGDAVQKYTQYMDGQKQKTQLFKIYDINKNIDMTSKKNLENDEWLAKGKYAKHDAEYHYYPDGSITADYEENGKRFIYTYDKDGVLKNERIISSDKELLTEFDELGNVKNREETDIINIGKYVDDTVDIVNKDFIISDLEKQIINSINSDSIDSIIDQLKDNSMYKKYISDDFGIVIDDNDNSSTLIYYNTGNKFAGSINLDFDSEIVDVDYKDEFVNIKLSDGSVKTYDLNLLSERIQIGDSVLLDSSYYDSIGDGYKVCTRNDLGDKKLIGLSKEQSKAKLYLFDENANLNGKVTIGYKNEINNITVGENGLSIELSNGKTIDCTEEDIYNSISHGQSRVFANENQINLADTTDATPSTGYGQCEAWAEQVYRNAGYPVELHVNAKEAYDNYCHSSDYSDLEVGMIVAIDQHTQSPAGSIHGHIGVYIGDGIIKDNVGNSMGEGYIREMSVTDWADYYNTYSKNGNPVSWGWMDNNEPDS